MTPVETELLQLDAPPVETPEGQLPPDQPPLETAGTDVEAQTAAPDVVREYLPSLAGRWHELSPEDREAALSDLVAQLGADKADGNDGNAGTRDGGNADSAQTAAQTDQPPTASQEPPKLPDIPAALIQKALLAFDGDPDMQDFLRLLVQRQDAVARYATDVGQASLAAVTGTGKIVQEILLPVREERIWEQALVAYNRANASTGEGPLDALSDSEYESVTRVAMRYRKDHPTVSPADALDLALARRGRTPADTATRAGVIRRGIQAGAAATRGGRPTPGKSQVFQTVDDIEEDFRKRSAALR